ncbi:hypothetical protein KA005_48865 [bacterium]|nr:hypothetical protein [bacterium]
MDADTESIEAAEDAHCYYEDINDSADGFEDDDIEDNFGWESLGIGLGLGEEIAIAERPLSSSEHQNNKLPLSARRKIEDSKDTKEDLTKPANWLTKLGNVKYHLDRNLTDKEREALKIASDISDILKSEREFNRIDKEYEEAEKKAINYRTELSEEKMRAVGRNLLKRRKKHG